MAVSGERTKTAVVTRALEEFIARREQKKLLDLFGTSEWDPSYDYKAERSRNHRAKRSAGVPPARDGRPGRR